MRGHVDPETLAEFREELLSWRRARRVAAHLAHCTQCAGLDARLAGLPTLLARAPAPPMPDALTTRIEAAIAAEAAARAAAAPQGAAAELAAASATRADGAEAAARTGDAGGAARGRRGPEPARDRSRLALRIAVATAAVAVVGGGGYGVSRLFSAPAPLSTASGASAAHAPEAPAHGRGTSRVGSKIAGSSEPAVVPSNGPMAGAEVTSGTNFLPGRLRAQVEAALTHAKQAVEPAPHGTFSPAASLSGPGCLNRVTGGGRPLLVEHARYAGKPATVIVFPDRPGVLRAVVVGPGCSATTTDQLASTTLRSSH